MKQTTLYVTGMHCSACELLIEKKLLTLENITGVDASLSNEQVIIHTDGKLQYSLDEMNAVIADLGYVLSRQKPAKKKEDKMPILYFVEGEQGLKFHKAAFLKRYEWVLVLLAIYVGWQLIARLELGRFMSPEGPQTLLGVLGLGVVASVSSCAALIGGLLLSLTKQWHEKTLLESSAKKVVPHMQFHIGRIAGFAIFGGLLGLIGERVTFDNTTIYALLVLVVSAVMVVLALQMLGVSVANKLRIRMPQGIAKNILAHPKRGPFLIGAGTFFLPCGFTLIAQALALASGSLVTGAFVMGLFALGTLPVLLGISLFGLRMNTKPARTARFNKYAGILILLFALYNMNGQLNVLGLPSVSDLRAPAESLETRSAVETNSNGEQVIRITAEGFYYKAMSDMTISAGVPTILEVDNQGIRGCGAYLAVAGLMKGYVSLTPGANTIDLGKPTPGTYKITCSMGMVAPVILTVQ